MKKSTETYRILIVTNDLYPHLNANSEIAYRIGDYLHKYHGCDITILGYSKARDYSPPADTEGFRTVPIESVTRLNSFAQKYPNLIPRITAIALNPSCYRYYVNFKRGDRYSLSKEYAHAIRALHREKRFDCIIGFSNPTAVLHALSGLEIDVPYIAYKLDPWSSHYKIRDRGESEAKDEYQADKNAAAILTTGLIREDYPADTDPEILKKIHVLEFPNVTEAHADPSLALFDDREKIHCVFAGGLYEDIRNPDYAIQLFGKMKDDGVVFHLLGKCYGSACLPERLPENVIYHGPVETETAQACIQAADVLVNIGNTIKNQMPSKLLTYISLGSPILNIVKRADCPTLPYLEKYPLALNVLETPELSDETVEQVRSFIMQKRGKHIPFAAIKSSYMSCTLDDVGGKVYEIIRSTINKAAE